MSALPYSPALRRTARRRLVGRLVVAAVLLAVLLVAALLWPHQRTDALDVPTTEREALTAGVVTGRLEADRRGDRVCYTVDAVNGPALLVLPPGSGADEALGLLDPTGVVVAAPGALVDVTGDPGRIGSVTGCSGTGRIWRVSEVRLATG